uniref:GST N-terminal domain-containing protein n=1 Tax=Araucaria cunninghamii TaxID=56994 RepID=A0A0D6R4C2_ARACU
MQFYHHPYSFDSQKVRLALEEKEVDYWPYRINPLKARNLDSDFFRINPTGKIPVLMNGKHVIFNTFSIIQYIDSINEPLGGHAVDRDKMLEWMRWIDTWNPKLFTLIHVPDKYRLFFSKFQRRAAITRMSESPDLIGMYRLKLQSAYTTEEQLKEKDLINNTEEQLIEILDAAEKQLASTNYLAGGAFSMADCMFVPILARIELLNLSEEYISPRLQLSDYWSHVKKRPSYHVVIGKYFSGWRKYKTLYSTYTSVWLRNLFRRY